jgi:hypothetical protein
MASLKLHQRRACSSINSCTKFRAAACVNQKISREPRMTRADYATLPPCAQQKDESKSYTLGPCCSQGAAHKFKKCRNLRSTVIAPAPQQMHANIHNRPGRRIIRSMCEEATVVRDAIFVNQLASGRSCTKQAGPATIIALPRGGADDVLPRDGTAP